MSVCGCTYIHICIHVCMCAYIHIHTHTHTHTHTQRQVRTALEQRYIGMDIHVVIDTDIETDTHRTSTYRLLDTDIMDIDKSHRQRHRDRYTSHQRLQTPSHGQRWRHRHRHRDRPIRETDTETDTHRTSEGQFHTPTARQLQNRILLQLLREANVLQHFLHLRLGLCARVCRRDILRARTRTHTRTR